MKLSTDTLENNRTKIFLSPHFDDLPLSLGGLLFVLAQKRCPIEDWVIFSRSCYRAGDSNSDTSSERIAEVSAERQAEELAFAKSLGNVTVKPLGFGEANLRGHSHWAPRPNFRFNKDDLVVVDSLVDLLRPYRATECDIFAPLAVWGHIDHITVREAVLRLFAESRHVIAASLFFYEDIPYIVDATHWQRLRMYWALRRYALQSILVPVDLEQKVNLLQYYPSQFDPSYSKSIMARGQFLQHHYRLPSPAEQLFAAQRR